MNGHDFFNQDRTILFNWCSLGPGEQVPVHKHSYAHDCFLLKGRVKFIIGPIVKELEAPDTIHFVGESIHSFEALSEVEMICTHPTDKAGRSL